MERVIDHSELDAALRQCGSDWSAGQAHGLLCSRLSLAGADGASRWLAQILSNVSPDNAVRAECEVLLDALYNTTAEQLAERQSEFVLLLPDDNEPAFERTEAMAHWCEGFLHGLVADKHDDKLREFLASEPLSDIIKDMLQITRASVGDDGEEESNEAAYAELVEYLRVAVQLAYEELAQFRRPQEKPKSSGAAEVLH